MRTSKGVTFVRNCGFIELVELMYADDCSISSQNGTAVEITKR
jgi:hypothetical protein